MRWQMNRPSPVPSPTSLVVKKGSNRRAQVLLGNAVPGVVDLDHHALLRVGAQHQPDLVLVRRTFADGVGRVDQQIEKDLTQARGIAGHGRHARVVAHHTRVMLELVGGQLQRRFQDLLDIHVPEVVVIAA